MTTTFEHAEVGDRVWSLKNGWGTDAEPSSGLICLESNSKKLRRLIENGVAYPDTKEGRKAAAAHARALLGEGEPWEE